MSPRNPEDQRALTPAPLPQERPAGRPRATLSAMERFSCLAERCEDTCCRDWAVTVDRKSFDHMRGVLSRTEAGRERLVRLVVVGRPSAHVHPQVDDPVHLQMTEAGACPMLESDNRCGVHAEFGEQALTTTCAIFPRTSLAVAGRLEIGGSLGCPEVARLVLLDPEPLRLVATEKEVLPREYVGKTIPVDPEDLYGSAFLEVRQLLSRLVGLDGLPLAARLVAAAHFADRVAPFFGRDGSALSRAQRTMADRRLRAEIEDAASPALLGVLQRDFEALAASGESTMALVLTSLLGRRRLPHSARFAELLRSVFTSLQAEALGRPAHPDDSVTPGQIWAVYRARREALDRRLGAAADTIFGRFCEHFVLRHPYTESRTLVEYLYKLTFQLAAVRLLALGHPDLAARLAAPADPAEDLAVLERVAVHAVQTFTKAIGHSLEFLGTLNQAADEAGAFSFGTLVLLAKFV